MRFFNVVLLFVGLCLLSGCTAVQEQVVAASVPPPAGDLPVTVIATHTDYNGRIFVEASYPGLDSAGDKYSVTINGRDWPFTPAGYGSGSGELSRTFELIPGYPGRKDIAVTVTHDGKTGCGQVSVDYAPTAAIEPAWVDGQLCLQQAALEVRLRYVNNFSATLNGVAVSHAFLKAIFADGMEQVAMLEATLAPGRNVLVMTGQDWRGQPVTLTSALYFAPDGVVRVGDAFSVVYGEAGSRSGPFYSTAIPGEALENGRDWETPTGKLVREFRAVKPGRAVINIFKKAHFRGDFVLERTINLTVR